MREAAIHRFLADCYRESRGTSFACVVEIKPDGKPHTHFAQVTEKTPHAAGTVRAHVFSITKSMLGLLAAQYVYDRDGKHGYLRRWLLDDAAGHATMDTYLDRRSPVRMIGKTKDQPLRRLLTMTSGIPVGDTDALYVAVMEGIKRPVRGATDVRVVTFTSLVYDRYQHQPLTPGVWRYCDTCMQFAAFAVEEFERAASNNYEFMARDEISRLFFPPSLRAVYNEGTDEWPVIDAGYDRVDASGKTVSVYNTLAFYGLRMTGLEMRDLAVELLLRHHDLLTRIYNEPATDAGGGAVEVEEEDQYRSNWRYWLFWWIPVHTQYPGRWISAIGHMGQFILLELDSRRAFIRQHFVIAPMVENVDLAHVARGKSDCVRMPDFPQRAAALNAALNAADRRK